MAATKLVVRIFAVALLGSLIGIIAYQQSEISMLSTQKDALEASILQASGQASSLTAHYEEEIVELTRAYSLLNSSYLELLRSQSEAAGLLGGHVFFGKIVYSPSAEAFWDSNAQVSIDVIVVDCESDADHVTARVSSGIHTKEVILDRTGVGMFKGSVLAVGLRPSESISDTGQLNVRYGSLLIAEYDKSFDGLTATAVALFEYPVHVTSSENTVVDFQPWGLVDSEGVPLVYYGSSLGAQYNPTIICDYALTNYDMYVTTGNFTFWRNLLTQANWLVKNSVQKGDFSVWEYRFDWPWGNYNATDPFVSALAQGEGLSVLTRAYVLTGNETYLDVAEASVRSFGVEMDLGGVRHTDADGVWYEEIADAGAHSGKVLNGFMNALFGLYEFWFETGNDNAYSLFFEGTHTLSENIYRYDTGSWSYYDLLHHSAASLSYHKQHIAQLRIMYQLTGIEIFSVYSDKFQSYIH
jgi:hypothetical protein